MDRHAFITAHGNNIALQVAHQRRVTTLVDREQTQPVLAGVGVSLNDDPSRRVTDAEIQDLALADQGIEGLHQLGNLGSEVPCMNIKLCFFSLHPSERGWDYARTRST